MRLFNSNEQNKFVEHAMNKLDIINRAIDALNERIPTGKAEVQVAEDAVFLILMGKSFGVSSSWNLMSDVCWNALRSGRPTYPRTKRFYT